MKLNSQPLRLVIIILFARLYSVIEGFSILSCYGHRTFMAGGQCFQMGNYPQTFESAKIWCEAQGMVLARIYSESELRDIEGVIKKLSGPYYVRTTLWVGASDLQHEGRFYWLADNSEIKRNSSLWNKGEPNNDQGIENCVEINLASTLNDVPCDMKKKFLCTSLEDGLLSMRVSDIEMSRNEVVRKRRDKNFNIRCDLTNKELLAELTLTLNDEFLMKSLTGSLIFHVPVAKCNYSGNYICEANILKRRSALIASTAVSIDIYPCTNASDVDNISTDVDKGRPVCAGPDTELSEGSCFRYIDNLITYKDAQDTCRHNDAVLPAFKSLSQLQKVFKILGASYRGQFWVGANNLQDLKSFRWIANRKLIRTDSPMWSKKLTSKEETNNRSKRTCLVRDTQRFLFKSDCQMMYSTMCMDLYSEVLTVNVNDKKTERNAEIFISKNSTMTIECLAPTTNTSIILSIRFKDHMIMTVSNQSRLVYDVDNAQCEDAGRYSCNVDFTDSGISVEYFIFIDMDCPTNVTLSTDQKVATISHHVMTSVGSDLFFNCAVNYPKEDFYLEILKNNKVLTTQYAISTVTFNLSVTGCNASDVYTCQYHQLHPEMNIKSSPLIIGVNNCPIHILSFRVTRNVYMFHNLDESEVDEISGESEYWNTKLERRVLIVCDAETYSRPTTLLIKSESGNVLKSQENTSFITLYSGHMTCKDKGKLVCQITDHLRNETDSKTTYTWVRNCEPSFCRHQNHFKRLRPHLSHNVTATFCFMMDRTLHRIHEKQLFHDGRLLETNSTSKHVVNIMADRTHPYHYTLDVILDNVQVEDFGQYLIHLKFNDRTVLTFLITVQNSVSVPVQSSSHDHSSPFMSYGLPCVIFLLLILFLVATYRIVKKTKCTLKNARNKGDVAQVIGDEFKYTTLRED